MRSRISTAATLWSVTAALTATPAGFAGGDLFIVTTTEDTTDANVGDGECADVNGDCSLRAAVQEANASDDLTRIRLQDDATYVLSIAGAGEDAALTGDLDVTSRIRIHGEDATIDAAGLDRAFDVLAGGELDVRRITVTGGAVVDANGGGFRSSGTLKLRFSVVHNCFATGAGASGGAIANEGGALIVRFSTLAENSATRAGGAVEAIAGETVIRHCELLDNETGPGPGNGGAVHLTGAGDVLVRQTLVQGNIAAREGGGLWNSAVGVMTVRQCHVEDNEAHGTAADDGGGGLFNDGGEMTVLDTHVRGNAATMGSGSGGGIFNNGGELHVDGSVIQDNESNRAGGGIEAVDGTTLIDDSRIADNHTGSAPGNGGGLHLTGAGLVEIESTEVEDNFAAAEGGGLWNSGAGVMSIEGCVVEGNTASGEAADQGGGGVFNDGGTVMIATTSLTENAADGASGSGGGAFNNGGTLSIVACLVADNTSHRAGGGIEAREGTTTIELSLLEGNQTGAAPGNGGAVHLTGAGTVSIWSSAVFGNSASAEGGGLWNSATGEMSIDDCVVLHNVASGDDADQGGGGLFNDGGDMEVTSTLIRLNDADGTSGSGGGILNNQGQLLVTESILSRNTSSRAGGGIEANAGVTTLEDVVLLLNATGDSPGNGGALHLSGPGAVHVSDALIFLNSADNEGGGLWNSSSGTMTVEDSAIFLNAAPTGPNVFNDGGDFTIDGDPVPPGG